MPALREQAVSGTHPDDIDPAKALQLIRETEEQWEAMKRHPVLGELIRSFDIPLESEEEEKERLKE
jgi:hypothetical protein